MKRKFIALFALAISIMLTGCGKEATETYVEHTIYFAHGRYYTDGTVITNDGNEWGYQQDTISEKPSYNNEPVIVGFDDNGTQDYIYDDIIVGLVLDRETAIYDELEAKLSQSFEIERNGNIIKVKQ